MRRSLISTALLCASFFLFAAATQGQNDRSARLASLTADVAERTARGRFADPGFLSVAKSRLALMSKLAATDPKAVLDNALTGEQLVRIPASARAYFERRETLSGEIEVIAECEEHDGRIHRYLLKDGHRFELAPAGDVDETITTGNEVELNGVLIGDRAVFEGDQLKSVDSEPTTNSLSNTTGEKRVLVILVNFQDKQTQPFTVEHARDVTFNQTSNFLRENSYGQTWLTGDVYGWYTIPMSSTSCDTMAIATYAKQAAANAGANVSSYSNVIYGFPSNSACSFTGLATIGGSQPQVWVNDWFRLAIVAHELGHNLGLFHSRALECGSVAVGNSCSSFEYGDVFDVMGGGDSPHYHLFQKERLGWVNGAGSPPLQTVTASGLYWIDAYVPVGQNSKGLKILKSTDSVTGRKDYYFIEKRTPVGFDSYLGNIPSLTDGVLIHTGSDTSFRENYLLDMTPETTSWFDASLTIGRTFTDPDTGTAFTVISADASGALVQVQMQAVSEPCDRANPTVSLAPGVSSWTRPGVAYTYQLTVTNNNSGTCGAESFDLSATLPAGFSAGFSTGSVNLASGSNATVFADVTSPVSAGDGSYGFTFAATNTANAAYGASAGGTHVIVSSLTVTATPGAAKYSRSQTATVTATVSAAGGPVMNADVTFVMVKPGGSTVTQIIRTGSDGRAVFRYKFNRKADPTGTYTVSANSAIKTYTGTSTTSFLVNK